MMQLSVKTLDSLTHNFTDLDEEITVVDFKSHISSTVTLPPEQQRLIFRGRVLQDDKKLRDYNVTSGQVIHLVARNPTQSTPANDHPQPQLNRPAPSGGGGGGRNNAIIMGTIGTLEFSNSRPPNGTQARRSNSAAARLTVANQCLTRASNLLQTLEDEVSILQPHHAHDESSEDDDEAAVLESIALHHATTTATIMASVQQAPPIQVTAGNSTAPANTGEVAVEAPAEGSPSTESGYVTPNTGTSTARREAPMLHELATSINDVIALNSRLTPYLQTLQRWLVENGDLGENQASIQYTYNAISSVLHSLSHSIHALSDLTVDFSVPPAQRRLRAPTTVWVEQSPVVRATIPIGVQVGVETTNAGNPTGGPPNPSNPSQTPQGQGQGPLPGGGGGGGMVQHQLQQVLSNILQGVISGQIQQPTQQQPQSAGGIPASQPLQPPSNIQNNNSLRGPNMVRVNRNPFQVGSQGFQIPLNVVPGAGRHPQFGVAIPAPTNGVTQNGAPPSAPPPATATGPIDMGIRTTLNSQPLQSALTQRGHLHSLLESATPPQRAMPRLEQMILQCRSHHYQNPSVSPSQRPANLSGFLSRETGIPVGEETIVFETVVSLLQGLSISHPILAQYFKTTLLRGRDSNNLGHITTAVRPYARNAVEWVVASISATRSDFDVSQLTTKLVDIVTHLMSNATHILMATPPGSPITSKLGPLLNEWMPQLLEALGTVFPQPEHLRIFKGIILLIVNYCFPGSSVIFTTRVTAGIADYLISCQPNQTEPEVDLDDEVDAEISMEIDVEFEDALDTMAEVEAQMANGIQSTLRNSNTNNSSTVPSPPTPSTSSTIMSTSVTAVPSSTLTRNPVQASASTSSISEGKKSVEGGNGTGKRRLATNDHLLESDDDDDEAKAELQSMTNTLFRDVPEAWHETLLLDIQRQEALRQNPPPEPSPGFLSIFPRK